MEKRSLGKLGIVSALTLGGGGIGQVWGHTTRQEAVATVWIDAEAVFVAEAAIGRIALLPAIFLNDPVAAGRQTTIIGALVVIDSVPVVALFGRRVSDTIAAHFDGAIRAATVARRCITVVAEFLRIANAIAAKLFGAV